MKKIIKMLALLGASVMLAGSLLACDHAPGSTTVTDTPYVPVVGREGMMPSDIREILPNVEWAHFSYSYQGVQERYTSTYWKDGDIIYHENTTTSLLTFRTLRYNRYIDCATDTLYQGKYNSDEWFTRPASADFWQNRLNAYFFEDKQVNPAFTTESYGVQNEDGSYDGKPGAFPPSVKSVNFKGKGTTYVFLFEMEDVTLSIDGKNPPVSVQLTITFEKQSLQLPTDAKPDPSYNDTPETEKPDAPPTPSQQMNLPEGMITPVELYESLLFASNADISLRYNFNGVETAETIEWDAGIVYTTKTTPHTEEEIYYDLRNHLRYDQVNGAWYYQYEYDQDWRKIVESIEALTKGALSAPNDCFRYDVSTNQILMLSDAWTRYGLKSMTLQQTKVNALCTRYLYNLVYQDGDTLTMEFTLTHDDLLYLPDARPYGFPVGVPTPMDIYNQMASTADATVTIRYTTPYYTSEANLRKDGDLVEIYRDYSTGTELYYYDTAEGIRYGQEAGSWYCSKQKRTWEEIIDTMNSSGECYLNGIQTDFAYNADHNRLVMKSEYLSGRQLKLAYVQLSSDSFTITVADWEGITLVIEFCPNIDSPVELPVAASPKN